MYQIFQEGRAVPQIRPALAEELKQFLADRLLHAEAVVVSLWWGNTRLKKMTRSHREGSWFTYETYWLAPTYVHGQILTVSDVGEAEHLSPSPAPAFDPSICRQQRRNMWNNRQLVTISDWDVLCLVRETCNCVVWLLLSDQAGQKAPLPVKLHMSWCKRREAAPTRLQAPLHKHARQCACLTCRVLDNSMLYNSEWAIYSSGNPGKQSLWDHITLQLTFTLKIALTITFVWFP